MVWGLIIVSFVVIGFTDLEHWLHARHAHYWPRHLAYLPRRGGYRIIGIGIKE